MRRFHSPRLRHRSVGAHYTPTVAVATASATADLATSASDLCRYYLQLRHLHIRHRRRRRSLNAAADISACLFAYHNIQLHNADAFVSEHPHAP